MKNIHPFPSFYRVMDQILYKFCEHLYIFSHTLFIMKCSYCGSQFGYLRLKTRIWICRLCGHETKFLDLKQMTKNFMGISKK